MALVRVNSGNWRKELTTNAPLQITLILPNNTTVSETISKFDLLIETLCAKHGLNPNNHVLKDVNNPTVKFTKASSLADFEENPYSAEDMNSLTLQLTAKGFFNRMFKGGKSRKRRYTSKRHRRNTRNRRG